MGWILQGQGDGSSQDHLPFLLQILAVCLGPLQLRSSVSSHPAEMGLLCGQLNLTHGSHTHTVYIYIRTRSVLFCRAGQGFGYWLTNKVKTSLMTCVYNSGIRSNVF